MFTFIFPWAFYQYSGKHPVCNWILRKACNCISIQWLCHI